MEAALAPVLAASAPQATAILSLVGTAITAAIALIVAVVAALVALFGHSVIRKNTENSLAQARQALSEELQQKYRALDVALETARQAQAAEIVKRRADTYPELYRIISDYGRSWDLLGKPRDAAWAGEFLGELLSNNAKNGVFFSKKVYEHYGYLREFLVSVLSRFTAGESIPKEAINLSLYAIIMGKERGPDQERDAGLGSYLKNELGGYVEIILSAEYQLSARS